MLWIASILTTAASLGMLSVGIMLILGQHVLTELTRPGVTIEPGTPEWGNLVLPEAVPMPGAKCENTIPLARSTADRMGTIRRTT